MKTIHILSFTKKIDIIVSGAVVIIRKSLYVETIKG